MRFPSGSMKRIPVRNESAYPIRPSTIQSWPNVHGPSIVSRIPNTSTASDAGMKILCAIQAEWPLNCFSSS